MYGLDLFSGIGGITKALEGYVYPAAYCENDRYAQAVLLSRMATGDLPVAPIWDDVRTLSGDILPRPIDIIYGGFPCQDISVAGRGAGLAGKRSGLFFEIARLVSEIRPRFIFLENVPAIHLRGGDVVVGTLANLGYDCRWDVLSAADVGANHRRERWWLLAYANDNAGGKHPRDIGSVEGTASEECGQGPRPPQAAKHCGPNVADAARQQDVERGSRGVVKATAERQGIYAAPRDGREDVADTAGRGAGPVSARSRYQGKRASDTDRCGEKLGDTNGESRTATGRAWTGWPEPGHPSWWLTEPDVGRVAHGVPKRVDRLRALGNAVVPAQAKEAFERLMGLKGNHESVR